MEKTHPKENSSKKIHEKQSEAINNTINEDKPILNNIEEDNTDKKKESIQNEILAFIDENMDSIRERMNTLDYSNSLINNNSHCDEEILNYNGEKIQIIPKNENLFQDNQEDSLQIKEIKDLNETLKTNIAPRILEKICNINGAKNELLTKNYTISCRDSCQTSATSIKKNKLTEKNNFINFDTGNTNNNNYTDIQIFLEEINLKDYTNKLIDNGFDDLNVIINQTKEILALSDQNLKDIGVKTAGDRAKILIHLEEKAGVIPFFLEDEIIYNKNLDEIKKENSIENFLKIMGLTNYTKDFIVNGYNNSPLLFSQMLTRQPITDDILKNDIGINSRGDRNKILLALFSESQKYSKKLKNRNSKTFIYDEKKMNICEPCLIY